MNIRTEVINETNKVEWYADRINSHVKKTVEHIIDIGNNFISAKENLQHGEFSKLFELTPITQRTAQKYMKIARSGEVQQILKNEPNSHLSVTKLYQLASGKSEEPEPAKTSELDWYTLQKINDSDPTMPFIDYYKREHETELMKNVGMGYDMMKLAGVFFDDMDELIKKHAETYPSILDGEMYPALLFNNDILVIGTGEFEDYIQARKFDENGSGDGFRAWYQNRYKLDYFIRIRLYDLQMKRFSAKLVWIEKDEITKDHLGRNGKVMHEMMMAYLMGSAYNSQRKLMN